MLHGSLGDGGRPQKDGWHHSVCCQGKLNDLQPDVFAASMSQNGEIALEPFIEIIDRCWAIGDFLVNC